MRVSTCTFDADLLPGLYQLLPSIFEKKKPLHPDLHLPLKLNVVKTKLPLPTKPGIPSQLLLFLAEAPPTYKEF